MAIEQLEGAAVGRPITRVGVSLFPVYLPGVEPIDIAPSTGLRVSELEHADVPSLTATNPGKRPGAICRG